MKLRLLAIATALALPCTYAVADNTPYSVAPVAQQPQVADTDRTQSPGAVEPNGRMVPRRYGDDRVYRGDRYVYRDSYGVDYSNGYPKQISPAGGGAAQAPDADVTMSPGAAGPQGYRTRPSRISRY